MRAVTPTRTSSSSPGSPARRRARRSPTALGLGAPTSSWRRTSTRSTRRRGRGRLHERAFAPEHIAWAIDARRAHRRRDHRLRGRRGVARRPVGVFVAPNFAIGAVLMQRFAARRPGTCRPSRSSSCITTGRPTPRRGRRPRRPTPSRPPVRSPGQARPRNRSRAFAVASERRSGSTRSGSPVSSRTRR